MTRRFERSSCLVASLRVDFRLQRPTCASDPYFPIYPNLTLCRTRSLNLDSLIWTIPNPPNGLVETPPPRSRAISGLDWAANQRQCHIVIGGLGADGNALSDVWVSIDRPDFCRIGADWYVQEYDYLTQYWSSVALSPGGPSARWGAAGGNDRRVTYLATAGLNNSFYLAGGQSKDSISPLSDVWRLNVSGTVSPNNPDQVFGSWESVSISGTLPSMQGLAGTVISQQIISSGGCNNTTPANTDDGCAVGNSYIINTPSGSSIDPPSCPVPRYEGVMVPNMNTASSSFSSQAFLLLGTFDSDKWNDAGGLSKGEVVRHLSHVHHLRLQPLITFDRQSSTLTPALGLGSYQRGIPVLFLRIPALAAVPQPSHTNRL